MYSVVLYILIRLQYDLITVVYFYFFGQGGVEKYLDMEAEDFEDWGDDEDQDFTNMVRGILSLYFKQNLT